MTFKIKLFASIMVFSLVLAACKRNNSITKPVIETILPEDPATFKQIAMVDLGGPAAAEISAYDPLTKRLFVVNNDGVSRVDVIDMSNFPTVTKVKSIEFVGLGWVNSVAVANGLLAVAVEAIVKQDNGSIFIYNTNSYAEVKKITVGALPDMVTFSPDGNYVISANEGEPNDAYTIDPNGTVSIIDVKNNYAVKTLDFSGFESNKATLGVGGFRVYGLNATLAKDVEPEYVTVSPDSKKAYVTLQENNGVAEVDLTTGTIIKIIPLGTRDISLAENAFDVSDKDGKKELGTWPIKAFYLPDAVSYFTADGIGYLALANEGDTRSYVGFDEEARVKSLTLDPIKFPTAAILKLDANLGRLTVSKFFGDTDEDGDYDELYTTGGRSLSIINASNGQLVANIGKDLEQRVINAGKYDDDRSDNKGVEVEGVTVAQVNGKTLAFIGMERVDMIAIYDISTPAAPKFVQLFETGDAPEGVLFVKPKDSPNGRSLFIVSNEGDGTVRFYQPDKL